jgi:phosphoglycolate phosphatase-like HAD superfamily hydrolase
VRPAALLIDLDGTVVSLDPPRSSLEELRSELLSLAGDYGVALGHHGIFKIYDTLLASGQGLAAAQARETIDQYEVGWSRQTAFPLLRAEVAARLEQTAIPTALVTNNGRACVSALHDAGKLTLPYQVAVTRDDLCPPKPAPDMIGVALTALRAEPGPIQFIGDSVADATAVEAYGDPALRLTSVTGDGVNAALIAILEAL